MKKNVLMKGILVLLVIALLTIGLTGCGIIIPPTPTTGTVDITVTSAMILGKLIIPIPINYTYNIFMDENYIGTTNNSGNLTKGNVLVGMHTFEAFSNFGTGHGSKVQNISSGINYVTISIPPIII